MCSPVAAAAVCVPAGNALEKAGGREFLDGVKELRKAQGPLEVASGTHWNVVLFDISVLTQLHGN